MQTGWVIYSVKDAKENRSFIDWIIYEAKLQNISLSLVLREEMDMGIVEGKLICYIKKQPVSLPNFAIVRTIERKRQIEPTFSE